MFVGKYDWMMGDNVVFAFQSANFLAVNLSKNAFTIHDYKTLISTPLFGELIKQDLSLIKTWQAADTFFEEHTAFIINSFSSGRPTLGIEMWLSLLERINQVDSINYRRIHKGTAYYHAGIYSLSARSYSEAFQWFEYAVEQDHATKRTEVPAIWLLTFDIREGQEKKGNDYSYTEKLLCKISNLLSQIKNYDSQFGMTENSLRGIVKSKIVTDSATRPLKSAWSALLASLLKRDEIERFLKISPQTNEAQITVNTFLVNLTLILETLIKKSPKGSTIKLNKGELGKVYEKIVSPIYSLTYSSGSGFLTKSQINATKYSGMDAEIKNAELSENNKLAVSFTLAQRVRNISHHVFNEECMDVDLFRNLTLRIYYSIFSIIGKLYV